MRPARPPNRQHHGRHEQQRAHAHQRPVDVDHRAARRQCADHSGRPAAEVRASGDYPRGGLRGRGDGGQLARVEDRVVRVEHAESDRRRIPALRVVAGGHRKRAAHQRRR
jgi:hypothetical protein